MPDFAICLKNPGFATVLELRKRYPVIEDLEAQANGLIRVIDESGEDYLYPARFFERPKEPSPSPEPPLG